jgi:hypothetical protein
VPHVEQNPSPSASVFPQVMQEKTPAPQREQNGFPPSRSLPQAEQVRTLAIEALQKVSVPLTNMQDAEIGAQCWTRLGRILSHSAQRSVAGSGLQYRPFDLVQEVAHGLG